MNRKYNNTIVILFLLAFFSTPIHSYASEKIFANYFDILANSPEDTEVTGRIHLERNKDVRNYPIPEGYHFKILDQKNSLFRIETRFDEAGRITGVLIVDKDKNTGSATKTHKFIVALMDDNDLINEFEVAIHVVKKTLWTVLYERYKDHTVSNKGSRMYGRMKFTDTEVKKFITEIEENNGRLKGFRCYETHPREYMEESVVDSITERRLGTIEYEWTDLANHIGGLGYSYALSPKYGPNGNTKDRTRLKNALYDAILAYTLCVPIEGDDVYVDGKPVGKYTGDGLVNLSNHHLIGHQIATHHWVLTDPLVAPVVHLMPELIEEIKQNNKKALKVHQALIRYYQIFSSTVENRRALNDPDERWGAVSDTIYSEGAWADANLGHRLRTMLALPIIWADYNRPSTYVPYWYTDFYNDKPFKGFSFSPGWSPHGVVSDVSRWLTKFKVPSHEFRQSGFHPDGTLSHHVGHGTDLPLIAYGFGWLTEGIVGFNQFKDTPFRVADEYYQFPADRLINVYGKIIYKGRLDFTTAGRSHLADTKDFVMRNFLNAIVELHEAKSSDTHIKNEAQLLKLKNNIEKGKHEYSGTDPYWVNEFLVHRRGENEKPFYASVKLKSERCVGAEDFDRVRKSWHTGSGVLQLRVSGNEYTQQVLKNMDWHMLPGITEEWRTDPLPAKGGAQACLPGLNKISGVLADGETGMAIYHHLPQETYSSATALKSYHFIDDNIIALGSNIQRYRKGQEKEIFTCIDQAALNNSVITYNAGGESKKLKTNADHDVKFEITQPTWVHVGQKGYLIFPETQNNLVIKTGKHINTTDPRIANEDPNYVIAIGHGKNPRETKQDGYHYVLLPNVTADQMTEKLEKISNKILKLSTGDSLHAVHSTTEKITQIGFFKKGSVMVNESLRVKSDAISMVMIKENDSDYTISVGDPTANEDLKEITLQISIPLKEGKYSYQVPGIYPREGEYATVSNVGDNSVITVQMPDKRDEKLYNYQSALYAGVPVVLKIPKK